MGAAILAILPALISLLGTLVQFLTSKEAVAKRTEADHIKEVNKFNEALAKNNKNVIAGMCLDQHDRVRTLLQGGGR